MLYVDMALKTMCLSIPKKDLLLPHPARQVPELAQWIKTDYCLHSVWTGSSVELPFLCDTSRPCDLRSCLTCLTYSLQQPLT